MNVTRFLEAWHGKWIWLRLKKSCCIRPGIQLILLGGGDEELHLLALSLLEEFLKKKYAKGAVVVTCNPKEKEAAEKLEYPGLLVKTVKQKELRHLIRFYCLQRFFDGVTLVSLEEPFGSYGLLEKEGISLKNLVTDYLFV